ncbi:galactokinase [Spirochaetia bacterium]|nr:galactokinase [Spirochaetia bacterium]
MTDIGPIHRKEYEITHSANERIIIAEAPGRIHYMGDHGQYKDGIFLCSSVDKTLQVAVSLRKDNSLRFYAADMGERKRTTLVNLRYKREDRWANFAKIAIYVFVELGCDVRGMNFTIAGDIPQNISLAASSAIEIASALVLRRFYLSNLSDKELLTRLAAAHSEFFENQNYMVDYLCAMNARKDNFLFIDETTMEVKRIKNPFSKYKFLLLDSRVPMIDSTNELKSRQRCIDKGLQALNEKRKGGSLKDYNIADMDDLMGAMNENVRRYTSFVIQEIQRIHEVEKALTEGDKETFSKNLFHSHEGLRDFFEVSCPEVDWLVKRAQETPDVLGARMTGKGFGGCTYTIVKKDAIEEYQKRLEDYERIFGFRPIIHEIRPAAAARIVAK